MEKSCSSCMIKKRGECIGGMEPCDLYQHFPRSLQRKRRAGRVCSGEYSSVSSVILPDGKGVAIGLPNGGCYACPSESAYRETRDCERGSFTIQWYLASEEV